MVKTTATNHKFFNLPIEKMSREMPAAIIALKDTFSIILC